MKETKESLTVKNGKLQGKIDYLESKDEGIRKEFAKAFDWTKSDRYSSDTQYQNPSWEEIFVEVGRLLSSKTINQIRDEFEHIKRMFEMREEAEKRMKEDEK